MKRLIPLLALSFSCNLQPSANPVQQKVPVYSVSKSEAHPDCVSDVKACAYYSGFDFGILNGYKCLTEEGNHAMYFRETVRNRNIDIPDYKVDRWYKTKLSDEISDEEFSKLCRSSFLNYKRFRMETDR